MKEKRIYVIDMTNQTAKKEVFKNISDQDFIGIAEAQGNIWTLNSTSFMRSWERGDLPSYDNMVMRILEIDN
jgi:hypothetical protein